MNAKYLEEIKARLADADIADDWDCVSSGLVYQDIPALLAEVERLREELADSQKTAEYCRNEWHTSTDKMFHYLDIIDKIREIDESSVKEACIALGDTELGYDAENEQ